MDQPAPHKPPVLVQPSIRSFFQPRQPTYAPPPAAAAKSTSDGAPPRVQDTTTTTNNNNKPPPATEPQPTTKPEPIPQPPPPPPAQIPGSPAPPLPQPTAPLLPASLPLLPPPPSLHPNASISPITAAHIPALRRINSLLLQVPYSDSFYTTIVTAPTSSLFSRAILWSDTPSSTPKVVGGIVCRLETPPPPPTTSNTSSPTKSPSAIYIQSLTLLSPYRSLGLASAALEHVASTAALLNLDPATESDIDTIYAHVWTENADGLRWYASRGFKRQGRPVAGYYFRLRPDTAWVVSRSITTTSVGNMSSSQHQNWEERRQADNTAAAAAAAAAAEQARGRGTVLASALNLPGDFNPSQPPLTSQQPPSKTTTATPPQARPAAPATSQSYQKLRPETEWNDLPAEMVASNNNNNPSSSRNGSGASTPLTGGLRGLAHLSAPDSGASSRSSSTVGEGRRKKKERAYPKAAFGPGS
ncbi:hypothetical protein GE09DRAFT_1115320 [Coniochaeta sp. 2T2.1]|nr:hypothetical protein GE09DRAFT_1115320 [Coniochaeta sp. 2T2.1]